MTYTKHPINPSIEALEARIAPASLSTLSYTDVDGDIVKVTSSHGNLTGHATFSAQGSGQHLDALDLTDASFAHTDLVFSVKRGPNGNGCADIGFLNATGNDLGRVIIRGDLDHIVAGDGNAAQPAVKLLSCYSIGATHAASTSPAPGASDPTKVSDLQTSINTLIHTGTGLINGVLDTAGNLLAGKTVSAEAQRLLGTVNSELYSLTGGATSGLTASLLSPSSGAVQKLGALLTDATKVLNLSTADQTALGVNLLAGLSDLTVKVGAVLGAQTGAVAGTNTSVTTHGLLGGLLGGLGGTVGSVIGGTVGQTIDSTLCTVGSLLDSTGVLGCLIGSLPTTTATLLTTVKTTLGQLTGLAPADLACLPSYLQSTLTSLTAHLGEVIGGTKTLTTDVLRDLAGVQSDLSCLLSFVKTDTSLLTGTAKTLLTTVTDTTTKLLASTTTSGGSGGGSGGGSSTPPNATSCDFNGSVGTLFVVGDVANVCLNIRGSLGNCKIGGSLVGGGEVGGGQLYVSANLNSLTICGNIVGGGELNTGLVHTGGVLKFGVVKGSLLGGNGTNSACIIAESDIAKIYVNHDLTGRDGLFSGSILNKNGSIGVLCVGGSVIGGHAEGSATISATNAIKVLGIRGSVLGDSDHSVEISALGNKTVVGGTNVALGKINVLGSVRQANILAGFDSKSDCSNGSAQIGSILVGKDWIASSVSAGVVDHASNGYGNSDDGIDSSTHTGIVSKIASITIRGRIDGTATANDHFGFTAGSIGAFTQGNVTAQALHANTVDGWTLGSGTGDVSVRECAH